MSAPVPAPLQVIASPFHDPALDPDGRVGRTAIRVADEVAACVRTARS